ncbi:isovaleryl-CoA dehydrogenase [Legionella antarctica]|uniref:Isovaleryl-CoA dehydrogenase n=1 Tax=Legionella antarctica TaxID=2708020 RepID=A0A6F8T1X3_9GAMM|nr:acyl-CoA dehydrogenase [Legionella antarctica]BCA94223.1 isovaleryl-CoA dehydrogenase [Legionella antarctica]
MPSYNDLLQLTGSFEAYLGNPATQETPMSFKESLRCDEQDSLAWPQIKFIQQWGFMEYLIPQVLGGKLNSLNELVFITRAIGRRDLTTAIALGISYLATLPVWIAGNSKQKQQMADCLRRGEIGAFALTEEEHGSDVAANEVNAKPYNNGWQLSGKKWCINFATLSDFATIVCRTHPKGGPLGFSVFTLDKSRITGLTPIPKLKTYGVRGLDISGFTLKDVFLPAEALIGEEKRGLEIAYKTLQVSRALCAGFAISCTDTALRMALSFSLQRQLYGNTAYNIPVVKQRLGEQFTQLLIADCTTLAMIRACSIMPQKLSFWSAILKSIIPTICENIVEQCGIVMGARGYLRTTEWAMFQKIKRDVQVVGLFDGSSQVNLSLISGNLLPQVGMRATFSIDSLPQIEQIFNLSIDCPEFSGTGLGLFTHSEDDIFGSLAYLKCESINPLITAIQAEIEKLDKQVLYLKEQKLFEPRSLTAFRLAERYCWIFAASCCLHFWHYNRERLSKLFRNSDWITLAIQLILNKLQATSNIDNLLQESMAEQLVAFYEENIMFSMLPTKIPKC